MTERPLRVAILHPTFWPEVRRGSERLIRDLADGLLARGHAPTLITSHPGPPRRTVEDGLTVIRNWRPPDGRLRRRMFEEHLTHVPFTYRSLRAGGFDVAQALYPTDALAALRWRDRGGDRDRGGGAAVLSYMGIPHRRSLANRRRRLEVTLRAFRDSDAVVVLSSAAAAASERWLGVRPRVIAPGVDLGAFAPGDGGERAPEPTFVCAAAIDVPRKRVALLIEAFAIVRRGHPDARLILSRPARGAGSEAALGPAAAPGVELADLDDRAALAAAYRRAWVSVLPSREEAFGLVLAEALACGTPGVGTRDGGIPEVLDRPSVGRLFEGEEPEALAAAMLDALTLAGDPRTAGACRARAEELSIDRCVDAYVALYREVLAGRGGDLAVRAKSPQGRRD